MNCDVCGLPIHFDDDDWVAETPSFGETNKINAEDCTWRHIKCDKVKADTPVAN